MLMAEVAIACPGNSVVFKQNNRMLFGDAERMLEDVLAAPGEPDARTFPVWFAGPKHYGLCGLQA